ncbi:hypothetical protein B7494_g5717 [Chlorociboria aeruginascens]|nr:hypothetical protein B7494_g5717 [Chlorociboria aeruginascens]
MLHIMNEITDKPQWEEKIFDEIITNKWKEEAMAAEGRDVSEMMADWIIGELRYKAGIFKETRTISVYNGDVVKSDCVVPESLKLSFRSAVKALEDIPEVYKDYHPNSDNKVIDLVHPSLFPLIYGRTRVLENTLLGLDDCLESTGRGIVVPIRSKVETRVLGSLRRFLRTYDQDEDRPYSANFQWLPCEVEFSEKDGTSKITSYINNLHPRGHADLYSLIEKILDHAIHLWNQTLTPLKIEYQNYSRIPFYRPQYCPDPEKIPDKELPPQRSDEAQDDYYERIYQWKEDMRRVVQPEPDVFSPPGMGDRRVDLKKDYAKTGLQNEHIISTALFYYDNKNIKPSYLSFRQLSQTDTLHISYPQDEHTWLSEVFGCEQDGPGIQDVGSVLCREGRLLTFPNILQHRVEPFELADHTKPGHRKILALFLVDPGMKVISTANVPPQQRDWWSEEVVRQVGANGEGLGKLSSELKEEIFKNVEDFPIGMPEAKELRLKLMEERTKYVYEQRTNFEATTFSLCEH